MQELTAQNAAAYLLAAGRVVSGEPIVVCELSGGVSNLVLLVELPARGERFVLKQARGRLRVQEIWLCPVERIWREAETLRICGELVGTQNSECRIQNSECGGSKETAFQPCVPEVLWEDRENYCFAMTAAPAEHKTWKELLLAGELAEGAEIAAACGKMLATLHGASWGNAEIAKQLDDRTFFDRLRIDPYYRHIAKVHPDFAPQIQQLIDSVWSHRQCLVHGDFSPKNLLVWQGSHHAPRDDRGSHHAPRDDGITRSVMPTKGHVMLIDCEVGHYGDPAFDLGFFLTHLVLKAIWSGAERPRYLKLISTFWLSYESQLRHIIPAAEMNELEGRTALNLAGCLLARVDGKSPVDYLSSARQEAVRELGRRWLAVPPRTLHDAMATVFRSSES